MEIISNYNKPAKKLNELQLSILRLLGQNITESQTIDLRNMLMDYFDKQLKTELETVVNEKNYTDIDYRKMLNGNS